MPRMRSPSDLPVTSGMRLLSKPPTGAPRTILERDAEFREALPNLVGHGKILGFAGFGAQVDQQFHQTARDSLAGRSRGGHRLLENTQDLTQLLEHNDAAPEVLESAAIRFLR